MNVLEAQQIANERRQRGQVAWGELILLGGIWPETELVSLPPQLLGGMGAFSAAQIQPIIKDALPCAPLDRSWPWLAHAAFVYSSELNISESYVLPELNADKLVDRIGGQAAKLHANLMALNILSIRGPEEIGKPHHEKAMDLMFALQAHFGAPQCTGAEYARFTENLAFIAKACKARRAPVASSRGRGATDPHLSLLVSYLANFWNRATDRAPSAADPVRKDGRPGPFVRLVNHCQMLAGQLPATMEAVSRAIENPPEFARKND